MAKKGKSARVELIVNPGAGNPAQTKDKLDEVLGFLGNEGFKVDVSKARPKGRATAIAKKAVKDGFKTVAAMGGDGMVEAVARGLSGSKTRLGIIPTGVENNIARNLGIPVDLEQACRLIATDNERRLDVSEVKTAKGKWYPFFEVVGMGFFLPLIPDGTSTAGEQLSVPPLAATTLKRDKPSPKAFISADDGKDMEVEARLVMVSNSCMFGEKYKVLHPEQAREDALDVSVFERYSKDDLRRFYAGIIERSAPFNGTIERFQTCLLKVDSAPRMRVMADGIELGRAPVSMRMREGALRVIAPDGESEFANKNREAYGTESLEVGGDGDDLYGFEP